ncbi:MAG: UDP-N-acetylmuramoyl-tripeptide--D-alanyl-D-alanine ligase, partial [Gammaproteobacteria bacterium]|nr:UDP-N-acetylmuramoyl-tripeptide--D-alanyl-D-alanine ligase [Gammaproteobacteria bacterium]
MSKGTLAELALIVEGELHGEDRSFAGVSTDTREISANQLFVALRGPNFDGNAFVAQAMQQGAAGALVEHHDRCGLPQVKVDNSLVALGRYANHWRRRFAPVVVGITGSNGKTTVKEMITSILRVAGRTHATQGNLNNEIGVPLTLLQLSSRHDFAVIEMGANHAGEIARLTAMVAPSVGVVTNAAPAHLEGFGSLDGVAHAKGELFEGLRRDAIAIINRDDHYYPLWRTRVRAREVLTFGRAATADFRVAEVQQRTNGHGDGLNLALETPDGRLELKLALSGTHNAVNAAAAAAAGWAAGVGLPEIRAGLERVAPVPGRLAIRRTAHGARIIDDSYNANPASVQAAIALLAEQPGQTWLVLG